MRSTRRLLAGITVALTAATLCASGLAAQSTYFPPKGSWERRTPAQMGLNPALVQQAVAAAQAAEAITPRDLQLNHSATFGREPFGDAVGPLGTRGDQTGIIVYRGYIIAEWGEPDRVDQTFSVAKSVLSSTVGIAFDRGLIRDVNDRVRSYTPPIVVLANGLSSARPGITGQTVSELYQPFEGEHNSRITWDHLLRQTSDWEGTLWGKPDWADRPSADLTQWTANRRHVEPGTVFEYNDARVNLLALAILNVWRRPLPQVAKEFLFDPIGASDTWRWMGYDNSWILLDGVPVQSVSGGSHWGGGLFINAYDQARFGLLTLNRGKWNGRQVLSDRWVSMALTPTPASPDYGFMNWYLGVVPTGPRSAFVHIGAGNNNIYVDPENELVIVTRWIQTQDRMVELMLQAIPKR